jgi:hypothetical protein
MKTAQNIPPSFDDKISIADMIYFFRSHKKIILIFVIIGALLGGFYGNFIGLFYKGSILISPAKIAGAFVESPKTMVTKINMNKYHSKETLLKCNPDFYKDKDRDKDIDYDMSNVVKASVSKDGDLIQLQMQDKNKIVIKDCLNSIVDNISNDGKIIVDSFIQLKKSELEFREEELKKTEEFEVQARNTQIKELKKNAERLSVDLLYANMILFNSEKNSKTMAEITKMKGNFYSEQTKYSSIAVPIDIKKKSFLTAKLGALIGLFLGLCLGILIIIIKQKKI